MTNCHTNVLEELPLGTAGYSTSPDPLSCRTKTAMFAADPYLPPTCFGAHRVDDIASQDPSASAPDGTLVAGVASLLALRYQHVQACVRPSNDKQAKRDQVKVERMNSYSGFAREVSKELQLIANMSDASSDEPLEGNEDADFDLLALLCSPSDLALPCSAAMTKDAFGDDKAKFRALSQQRQLRCAPPLTHPSLVSSARESSNELQLIANMSDASSDGPLEGNEEDADFDLLALLCSPSDPALPFSATMTKDAFGDDKAEFCALPQQRQPRCSQPLTHPSSVPACSTKAPKMPVAPQCGRSNGRRRPQARAGNFQLG